MQTPPSAASNRRTQLVYLPGGSPTTTRTPAALKNDRVPRRTPLGCLSTCISDLLLSHKPLPQVFPLRRQRRLRPSSTMAPGCCISLEGLCNTSLPRHGHASSGRLLLVRPSHRKPLSCPYISARLRRLLPAHPVVVSPLTAYAFPPYLGWTMPLSAPT